MIHWPAGIRQRAGTLMLLGLLGWLGVGCGCDGLLAFGIGVRLVGGADGQACDVTVEVKDGNYDEQLNCWVDYETPDDCLCSGAAERSGTYDVTVRRGGVLLHQTTVHVKDEGCHVKNEHLVFDVQP